MENREKKKSWIGWIYTAVLVMIAVAGIVYCSNLSSDSKDTGNVVNYAEEENAPNASDVLSENADAGDAGLIFGGDIIDLGDISTEVPLGEPLN